MQQERTGLGVVPTVTVVIPAYNSARYVERAIDSVLKQTLQPLDIIVVDDGSTDDTQAVVAAYGAAVTYVKQANAGVVAARSHGAAVGKGEWIAFLDADDGWRPEKLEKQMRAAQSVSGAVLVYCDYTVITEQGIRRDVAACPADKLLPTLRYLCPFMPSTSVIRRQEYFEVGGFDGKLKGAEDWDMWMRLVLKYGVARVAHVPECLLDYYVVPGSMIQQTRVQLEASIGLLNARLLKGLTGPSREAWRRRALARLYRDAAVALREQNAPDYLRFMTMSLWAWPFPSVAIQSDRYKVCASMILRTIQARFRPM